MLVRIRYLGNTGRWLHWIAVRPAHALLCSDFSLPRQIYCCCLYPSSLIICRSDCTEFAAPQTASMNFRRRLMLSLAI